MEVVVLVVAALIIGLYVGRRLVPSQVEPLTTFAITNGTEQTLTYTLNTTSTYPVMTLSTDVVNTTG